MSDTPSADQNHEPDLPPKEPGQALLYVGVGMLILLGFIIYVYTVATQKGATITSVPAPTNTPTDGPLCIGDTCMTQTQLKSLLSPTPAATRVCANSTCLEESDVKRLGNMFPAGYIHVVNRRPLFGIGGPPMVVTGSTPVKMLPNVVYNPFAYAVPAPVPGALRKFRLYCVYSDGVTGGDGPVVRLSVLDGDWAENNTNVDFSLPLSWGGTGGETRDALSNMVDAPSRPMHSFLYSFVPATATGSNPSVRWNYIELQALDVYPS